MEANHVRIQKEKAGQENQWHSSIGQVRRLINWLVFKKWEVDPNRENKKAHKIWEANCKEEIEMVSKKIE